MERKTVTSSNLLSIGYDASLLILEVEFKNRSIYQYFGVPKRIYEDLISAQSVGGYLNKHIKKLYKFKQIR